MLKYLDEEFKNMYTKEDFLRDYPPTDDNIFFSPERMAKYFDDLEEKMRQNIADRIEEYILMRARMEKQCEMIVRIINHRFSPADDVLTQITALLAVITSEDTLNTLADVALSAPDLPTFMQHLADTETQDS